ncbi:autotransporter secretion inner membrane protein TamB [Bisgaardia hudsonensis]|uniref:Autotransporter secretion inner membrane protein TamB n=1 Tax=Bisgaardia hudsonensis TaxID=109472 RepID=A0A4R2MYT3_9PAST|nr:translocation/assembly module TamB domain-containing protein [Bisgaardia hudsonensis]QLB12188.1 tubulin-binding protein [Bisgaardia hudsonensis]TCP12226.1 autotransporter secretion inner membrane protein TamB [Bisgaardia hudsonensis]
MTDKIDDVENTTNQKIAPPRKKNRWKVIFYVVSAIIILPILLLIIISTTNYGQKTAIQIIDKLMDNLTIEMVSGNLQDGLTLEKIQYQSKGVNTSIDKTDIKLDFSCLLKAKICLQNFSIDNPKIDIDTTLLPISEQTSDKNNDIHKIHLPISIEADNISVNNLELMIDNNKIDLQKFQTSFNLNNDTGLTLQTTQINQLLIQTQQIEKAVSKSEIAQKQPIDWDKLEQQFTPALLGNLKEIELPFDIHIKGIQGTDWQYQQLTKKNAQNILISNFLLQADATDYEVALEKFDIDSSLGQINANGKLSLKDNFPIDLNVQTNIDEFSQNNQILLPKTNVNLIVSGSLKEQTKIALTTEGITKSTIKGEFYLNQPKTPLNLKLVTEYLQYPIDKKAIDPLKIQNIDIAIQGNLLDYQIALLTNIEGMKIPKTEIDTSIEGTLSSIDIQHLNLSTLEGTTNLQGKLSWQDEIKWQSSLDLNKLNFSTYLSQFPAILSGKIQSTGQIKDNKYLINIPNIDITGTISKQPVSLKGNVNISSEKLLDIPHLLLNYGENKIAIEGYLSEQSDLNLDINAPNLSGLLPNLTATLFGNAKLSGNITSPNLKADLVGSNIKFQELRLAKMDIKADIQSDQLIQGYINLDMKDFSYNDIKLNIIKLTAKGDEKDHKVQLQSQGKPVDLNLDLSGKFDRTSQQWQGILSGINLSSPIGKWTTNKNVHIGYDNNTTSASINAHCWQNTDIDFCLPETFNVGKSGKVPFDIKRINLDIVNKLIEKETLKGELQSKGTVAWFTDKPLALEMQITGNNLSIMQKIDYRKFKLAIPRLQLNAGLKNNNLDINSTIDIENQGKILANILLKDLVNEKKLSGSLKVAGVNLNLANQLLSSNERIDGNVLADLTLNGSLKKPLLNGSFNVDNIKAKIKNLPFDISNGKINLAFQGNKSTLDGNIQTIDSQLNIKGNASWNSLDDWKTALKINGDKFNVKIPSIAKLKITPDIEITANPKVLELSGLIDIPWARIEIEELPDNAVPISEDEIILDGPNKSKALKIGRAPIAAKTKSGIEIRSNLKIKIGNDVTLNAYGLNTKLNGLLSVQQSKGNLGLYGQINLKDGRYSSFGQDLIIKKGLISFSGETTQPMLNIKAIRNPSSMENQNVTAGVNIVGVATSPEVTVFAQPSTSQAEALSYLLTGRSLENSGEAGSGGSIGAALLGIGLSKNGKLLGGIGEAFGIQDLNLGTSGAGNSSKVEVSGYITPRLQAKYGIGLFDGLAEFTLRYRLLPQLYLQSVSGVNQAVDLLYEFEF